MPCAPQSRPPVSVIVPFHGSREAAAVLVARLGGLQVREGDELIVADNSGGRVAVGAGGVRVVRCRVEGSAYAARNEGAENASAPWLLFLDADCRLPPGLLDAYFRTPPADGIGAVAGQVEGEPDQPGLVPRYVRSRRHLDQEVLARHPFRPMAVTANLLVRRRAWEEIGGFAEITRSGADADLCWRLQDAGWRLGYSAAALVYHEHRASLGALLAQAARDGAAGPWLARRYPGYAARLGARFFLRSLAGAVAWPLTGRLERGLFKALDGIWAAGFDAGSLGHNAPQQALAAPGAGTIVLLEEFPAAGDPLIDALADHGAAVRVEARRRPARMSWSQARELPAALWEDEGPQPATFAAAAMSRTRERLPGDRELAGAARRLRRAPRGASLICAASMTAEARRLLQLARRSDIDLVPLPPDPDLAAARVAERLPR